MALTKTQKEEVCKLYQQKTPVKEILSLFNISNGMLFYTLDQCKVPVHSRKITKKDIDFLKENYPNYGPEFCAIKLNMNPNNVAMIASRRGIKTTKKYNSERRMKPEHLLDIKLDQFLNIQTPEMAYFLGFLWADGHVAPNGKVVILCAANDIDDIEQTFMKLGQWKTRLVKRQKSGILREYKIISTNSKRLTNLLSSYDYHIKSGASPDKILSKIPEHLQHYWWRGYFDGDGHLEKPESKTYRLTMTSCYSQDWTFVHNLCKKLDIKYGMTNYSYINKKGKRNSHSGIRIGNGKGVHCFMSYIYKNYENDKIGLKRKYNTWMQIKEIMIKKSKSTNNRVNRNYEYLTNIPS